MGEEKVEEMALFQGARMKLTRSICTTAEQTAEKVVEKAPETYSKLVSQLHWLSAPAMMGCIASVLICQQSPKEEKGKWMFRHKSLGLLTGLVVAPRLITKLTSKSPGVLPGSSFIEEAGAKLSHWGLYGFMTIMPATGIAMGYFGGKGLPFFFTTIPGSSDPKGSVAGQA